MRSPRLVCVVLIAVISTVGCTSDLNPMAAVPCSMTLSGALTGTYPCRAIATESQVYCYTCNTPGATGGVHIFSRDADGLGGEGGPFMTPEGMIQTSVQILFDRELRATSYSNTEPTATGAVIVVGSDEAGGTAGGRWAARSVIFNPVQGSYRVAVTSLSDRVNVFPSWHWTVHGTLDATMPPDPGSSSTGVVTMHVTF